MTTCFAIARTENRATHVPTTEQKRPRTTRNLTVAEMKLTTLLT